MAGEAARFFARCAAVLRTRSTDRKLAEELESHFRTLEEEYRGKGMSPDEAYRTARLRLGGVQQLLEDHRDVRGFAWVDAMIRDAHIGIRSMKRTPGFTVVVLLTLAIGIGGTTAMFSMINTVLLRQLPYGEADRLVSVTRGGPGEPLGRYISADRLNIIKASARTFADIGAHFAGTEDALLVKGDTSEVVKAARVSANVLDILRVQPELGRPFLREDDIVGSAPTAMISDRLWRRRFGAGGSP